MEEDFYQEELLSEEEAVPVEQEDAIPTPPATEEDCECEWCEKYASSLPSPPSTAVQGLVRFMEEAGFTYGGQVLEASLTHIFPFRDPQGEPVMVVSLKPELAFTLPKGFTAREKLSWEEAAHWEQEEDRGTS